MGGWVGGSYRGEHDGGKDDDEDNGGEEEDGEAPAVGERWVGGWVGGLLLGPTDSISLHGEVAGWVGGWIGGRRDVPECVPPHFASEGGGTAVESLGLVGERLRGLCEVFKFVVVLEEGGETVLHEGTGDFDLLFWV